MKTKSDTPRFRYPYHPVYEDFLIKKMRDDAIQFAGHILTGFDARRLFRSGLVNYFTYDHGNLIANIDCVRLVIAREWDLAKTIADSSPADAWEKFSLGFLLHFLNGDTSTAHEVLVQLTAKELENEYIGQKMLFSAAWLHCFDDPEKCRRVLRSASNVGDFYNELAGCAEGWFWIAGEKDEAVRCLENAEKSIPDYMSFHLADCIEAWIELFDDHTQALRVLDLMLSRAGSSSAWISAARMLKTVFNDGEQGLFCMGIAERRAAGDLMDLTSCAYEWFNSFESTEHSIRCLSSAEELAVTTIDWYFCACLWSDLFNNETETLRCIKMAEKRARDAGDWDFCAMMWEKLMFDKEKAAECLKKVR